MNKTKTQDVLLSEREAALRLGVTIYCLRTWRYRKTGVRFYRIGRLVRYSLADINAFKRRSHVEVSSGPRVIPGSVVIDLTPTSPTAVTVIHHDVKTSEGSGM